MLIDCAPREFHVARAARDRYAFDQSLFSVSGNVIFGDFSAVRTFAQKMNAQRDLLHFPEHVIKAGDLNGMGLIDEILHFVVNAYRRQKNPQAMRLALDWLYAHAGMEQVDLALAEFSKDFPPLAVYRGEITLAEYMSSETAGVPNREIALEEMLMLWLANLNPAFTPFIELFDDSRLEEETAYTAIMPSLHEFFDTQPRFGPDNQNLIDMLRAPALASPNSLIGQLEFIRQRWGTLVADVFLRRLLTSLDLIREEQMTRMGGPGPAQVPVYTFGGMEYEPERYSADLDWMPQLVLIAKNVYVWMDQLSKKYGRAITRLDQVPDEELDQLSRWGFTGLWFIGLWERSPASRRIKQMMGNPEAVASAYSVFDYEISSDLGGAGALENLRSRAWRRGIRLASDMVPNHMAIDARWVIEHPDWFIGLDHSPFPSYSFNGPDLSWDGRVGLFLEDHYYNRSDAAVVFKRVDRWSRDEKYIYHGNDGTSFPWNDTAQLNYLRADVREAVIQTILHVARQFPIIRFDAAMTLAKKHFERLWFPEPGSGGAIPSRSEYGMTKAEFDAAMPEEFWREVVDRIAAEAPNTLLLAEAFWLMEGYFVRSLGMHRVYNSAFMNMLRDEDNGKYRQVMKNTLEFDPEVLKRYVNFMNNPDERTAVEQFGKGDKYFGVCILMATLPGLPMFGHGQIEGFAEKYGMEYQRAYWDEQPDAALVDRHRREIFPLLRRRYLFAGVNDFLLYDFYAPEGHVNEDVFAYSNAAGSEHALVIYHNKFASASGWVKVSAAYSARQGQGDERALVQRSLGEGLALHNQSDSYCILRDHITGQEYLRSSQEIYEKGLYVELKAYQYYAFTDIREVQDGPEHLYAQLVDSLNGRPVPSVDAAVRELALQPVLMPFRELVNPGMFRWLYDNRVTDTNAALSQLPLDEVEEKALILLRALKTHYDGGGDETAIATSMRQQLGAILRLPTLTSRFAPPRSRKFKAAVDFLNLDLQDTLLWGVLFGWLMVHELGKIVSESDAETSRAWIDELLFGRALADALRGFGLDDGAIGRAVGVIGLLVSQQDWHESPGRGRKVAPFLEAWIRDRQAQELIQVHRYDGIVWFNKEAFEELTCWMFRLAVVELTADTLTPTAEIAKDISTVYDAVNRILQLGVESQFQLPNLLAAARRAERDTRKARPRPVRARTTRPREKEDEGQG